jgi:hypothetical protein
MAASHTPLGFRDWLAVGVHAGWVSMPFCVTHDGPPYTREELALDDELMDMCVVAVRVHEDVT